MQQKRSEHYTIIGIDNMAEKFIGPPRKRRITKKIPTRVKDISHMQINSAEARAYFDKHPQDIIPEHLNNFHLLYPELRYEIKIKELNKGDPKTNSKKLLSETKEDFYRNVDKAIVDCGYKLEDIRQLARLYREGIGKLNNREVPLETDLGIEIVTRALQERSLKIYRKLREMGYNHYDLTR